MLLRPHFAAQRSTLFYWSVEGCLTETFLAHPVPVSKIFGYILLATILLIVCFVSIVIRGPLAKLLSLGTIMQAVTLCCGLFLILWTWRMRNPDWRIVLRPKKVALATALIAIPYVVSILIEWWLAWTRWQNSS
jgi:hypothetical protein